MSRLELATNGWTVRRMEPGQAGGAPRAVRQFVARLADACVDLGDLFGAFDKRGAPAAAVLYLIRSGRLAMVYCSPCDQPSQVRPLSAAVGQGLSQIAPDRALLAQAILPPGQALTAQALTAAGFDRLCEMHYLECRLKRPTGPPPASAGASLESWSDASADRFITAVRGSYEQTLDCAALHGIRPVGEVLCGYRSHGSFDPSLWALLSVEGEPAGVVLMNRVPQAAAMELVYLGLAPRWRGRGWGRWLLQHALNQAGSRGYRLIQLAVDARNGPGMGLYRSFGFDQTASRVVMIRPMDR